jgi:PD-(D/E)XK nuclease superfamily
MRRYWRRRRGDDFITAAELACFAYCPVQWRLEYELGLPPANRAALDAGTVHHAQKAVAERVAGGSIGLGRALVVAALVLLLLLWLV